MNPKEYEKMFKVEDDHWWYTAVHQEILWNLRRWLCPPVAGTWGPCFLDAGCGTGGLLAQLKKEGLEAIGVDFSEKGLSFCRKRGLDRLLKSSVTELALKGESFDGIISIDLLCQEEVDEQKALREFSRVLKPKGFLIMQVPAFPFLKSEHDVAVHVKKRYTKHELRGALERTGFSVQRLFYRNTLLFPVAVFLRLLKKMGKKEPQKAESDVAPLPKMLNNFLTWIVRFEAKIIHHFTDFPFGLSLFCVARKG